MTKYIIFGIELVVMALWIWFGPRQSWLLIAAGLVVIVLISQLAHHLLNAR